VAAAVGGAYITVTGDAQEYKKLRIDTVDALDPLDVGTTLITSGAPETGDLEAFEYPLLGDITRSSIRRAAPNHGQGKKRSEIGRAPAETQHW